MTPMQATNSIEYKKQHPDAVDLLQFGEYPIGVLHDAYITSVESTYSPYHAIFNNERDRFFCDLYVQGTSYPIPTAAEIEDSSLRGGEECITIDECAPLCGHGLYNFWHATMETVPRVVSLERVGFSGIYVFDRPNPTMLKYFEILDIPNSRVLITKKPVLARRCYLAPALCHGRFNDVNLLSDAREAILSKVARNISGGKRTYISRKDSRKVANEKEVRRVLKKYSFKCVDMADLPLKKQIELAASSSIIVGPHGAGMVLTLFQKPRSCVIELFSPHMTQTCIQSQVHLLDLNYYMLIERWPPCGRPYVYYENPSDGTSADMYVDDRLLRRTVERSIDWLRLQDAVKTAATRRPPAGLTNKWLNKIFRF